MDIETENLIREMWSDLATGQKNLETRLTAKIDSKIDSLEARLTAKIDSLEARFAKLETRFAKLEASVAKLEASVAKLEARTAQLEARTAQLEVDFAAFRRVVMENFARVQRNFELLLAEVRDPAHKTRLDKIEARLARIERHVGLVPEE